MYSLQEMQKVMSREMEEIQKLEHFSSKTTNEEDGIEGETSTNDSEKAYKKKVLQAAVILNSMEERIEEMKDDDEDNGVLLHTWKVYREACKKDIITQDEKEDLIHVSNFHFFFFFLSDN